MSVKNPDLDPETPVLVPPVNNNNVYHLVNDEGGPLCREVLRNANRDLENDFRRRTWREKTVIMLPYHRICERCGDHIET